MKDQPFLGFAVVANISDHLRGGLDRERFYQGTPTFSPGTKVYLGEAYWGMGGQNIHVIGLRRVSRRFVNCAVTTGILENLRVASVYKPKIWTMLDKLYGMRFADRDMAEDYLARISQARDMMRPEKLKPQRRKGPWGQYGVDLYRKET